MKRLLVIAYNHAHYQAWCREHGFEPRDHLHHSRFSPAHRLRGLSPNYLGIVWHDYDRLGAEHWKVLNMYTALGAKQFQSHQAAQAREWLAS